MQIDKQCMVEFADIVAQAVVKAISQNSQNVNVGKQTAKQEKSAYQKTEVLLYSYNRFKKILKDYEEEIIELRTYGVPKKCGGVNEFVQKGGLPQGLVLEEESIEYRISTIKKSMNTVMDAIDKIDKAMLAIAADPYYKVISYRYFDGRTQEDISMELGVSQVTISKNSSRLIRELSIRLFPDQVVSELFL